MAIEEGFDLVCINPLSGGDVARAHHPGTHTLLVRLNRIETPALTSGYLTALIESALSHLAGRCVRVDVELLARIILGTTR